MAKSFERQIDIIKKRDGIMRTSEMIQSGISPRDIYAMRDKGITIQLAKGLYRLADQKPLDEPDWVIIAKKITGAVICLTSALAYYEYTEAIPRRISIALPRESEKPRLKYPPLWIFWLSKEPYSAGIKEIRINDIPIKIYSLEKTIADCIKFRKKIGEETAIQAFKKYVNSGDFDPNQLNQYGKVNRVNTVMQEYLNAIL